MPFKILAILMVLLNSAACGDVPITLRTDSCSGRVIDAVTGEPIEGAVVAFIWDVSTFMVEPDVRFGTLYETTTDKKGKYFIPSQTIKFTTQGLFPRVEPEELIIYKSGYVVYRARNNKVMPIMIYLPDLLQKYHKHDNLVKLQPWIDELSHSEHISWVLPKDPQSRKQLQLLPEVIAEEAALAEKDRPKHKPMEVLAGLNESSDVSVLIEMARENLYKDLFPAVFSNLCRVTGRVDLSRYHMPETIPERKKALAEIEDWWEKNKDKNRFEWFCDLAVNSKNVTARSNAVETVGKMRNKAAVPYLIQCLNEKESDISVNVAAMNALVEIGDKSAIPHIRKRLKHKNVHFRRGAARALHKLGDDSGVPVVVELLKSWRLETRSAACSTLSQITDEAFAKGKPMSYYSHKEKEEIISKWLKWWQENKRKYKE
jgi:hypothetical protein